MAAGGATGDGTFGTVVFTVMADTRSEMVMSDPPSSSTAVCCGALIGKPKATAATRMAWSSARSAAVKAAGLSVIRFGMSVLLYW